MKYKENAYPKKPGVYLMRDSKKRVLYVGKAKNLHKRIGQYFIPGRDSRAQIPLLVAKIESIETIVVTSEKEALLLEHTLIKKHRPKYNLLLKDDKSYICIEITKHKWPALKLVRSKDVKKTPNIFGPYPSGYAARKLMYLLQRLFPLRECSDYVLQNRTRPCILYEMKRCIAPCVDLCSQEEYQEFVEQVRHFLKGQDTSIVKDLKKKMKEASQDMEYEKAGHYLETIKHIESILEKQNVVSNYSLNTDVIGLYREGESAEISLLSYQKGKLVESKSFPIEQDIAEDEELLSSFILQNYFDQKWLPHEILVPILPLASKTLASLLTKQTSHAVKIVSPIRGQKKKLLALAYDNAKSAFSKEQRQQENKEELLIRLKEKLKLNNYPEVIECFDNSHLSGTNPVSVMITFVGGVYDKSRLRKYHLNKDQVFDDLKGMEEVMLRRYKNQDLALPDLIIMDGGKTQLNVAKRVLAKLDIAGVDLIALTKEAGRHDFGTTSEKIQLSEASEPIILQRHSNLLFFLQTIRDQAHKSAILFQRTSRQKKTIKSVLDDIPGIGPRKKKALLLHFKSPKQIFKATKEELLEVKGLSSKDIENILDFNLP